MSGYSRPFSRSELRQMQRETKRTVLCCTVVLLITLTGVAGLIYMIYAANPQ